MMDGPMGRGAEQRGGGMQSTILCIWCIVCIFCSPWPIIVKLKRRQGRENYASV